MRAPESLFLMALAFYTTAIFSSWASRRLARWMIVVFGLGLLADASGTIILCGIGSRWIWTLHSIAGLAALLIMTLHFVWAALAAKNLGRWYALFHRCSIMAWSVWLLSFVTGIPASIGTRFFITMTIVVIVVPTTALARIFMKMR